MRSRDAGRVVVTQAILGVAVLAVFNAGRHHWALAALGEVVATGLGGVLAVLLLTRDR